MDLKSAEKLCLKSAEKLCPPGLPRLSAMLMCRRLSGLLMCRRLSQQQPRPALPEQLVCRRQP